MTGSPSRLSNRDLLSALLVIVLWGLNFVPTKYALSDFTPFQLGAARFLLAAFPLVFLVPRPQVPVKWLFLYAGTQGVGQFGLLFFALEWGMTASLASVLMQTQIFFTALMGALVLGESIPASLKFGMAIAGAGLACFVVNLTTDSGLSGVTAASFLVTLAAATMWACSNIVVKSVQATGEPHSPLALICWSCLISGLAFAAIGWLFDDPAVRWTWLDAGLGSWVSVLYLGGIANGVAFWLWTVLLTRHPASRVAPFSLGIPVVGMLAGIFLLGEEVTRLQWIGSLLVMSALVFVMLSSRRYLERMRQRYRRPRPGSSPLVTAARR